MKHDYSDIWPILPLGWWGASTSKYAEQFGLREIHRTEPGRNHRRWYSNQQRIVDKKGSIEDWENSAQPIPEREAELNRLAHTNSVWLEGDDCFITKSYFELSKKEWQERRRIRIKAGLIQVENPVTSSLTNSQTKEYEMETLKQEEWDGEGLPPVGVECEVRFRHPGFEYSKWFQNAKFKAGNGGKIWFSYGDIFIEDLVMPSNDVEFRPAQTEEQKIKKACLGLLSEMSSVEHAIDTLFEAGALKMPGEGDEN